ncbi:uncharacterized protein BO88DRAFT_126145 [Aspergillus vadensis CBS 113365]|uniref:Uncharacterized protein n=1 Tax=Aspergillus vadensis (strain CBS 113365 / IMI 142717 / IBT 24658) TaxID=1448311 RepID=A0A319CCT5_ASPVC|nr:hypothetical protein BO88DRAFT_126145 [Aspergillus vadensis CBS 113365]PYH66192.1 hypothetical protein BO88DRAFT_126145 [Aspergillus vadensis CBS 113365]
MNSRSGGTNTINLGYRGTKKVRPLQRLQDTVGSVLGYVGRRKCTEGRQQTQSDPKGRSQIPITSQIRYAREGRSLICYPYDKLCARAIRSKNRKRLLTSGRSQFYHFHRARPLGVALPWTVNSIDFPRIKTEARPFILMTVHRTKGQTADLFGGRRTRINSEGRCVCSFAAAWDWILVCETLRRGWEIFPSVSKYDVAQENVHLEMLASS